MRQSIRVAALLSIALVGAGADMAQAFHGHMCCAKYRGYAGFQSYGYMPMAGGYPSNIRMCAPGYSMGGCSMGSCYGGGYAMGDCYGGSGYGGGCDMGYGSCGGAARGGKKHGGGRLARMCGCLHGNRCGGWMSGCNGCFAGAFGCGDGFGSGCGSAGCGGSGCGSDGCGNGGGSCGGGVMSGGEIPGGMIPGGVIYDGGTPVETIAPMVDPSASLVRSPFRLTGLPSSQRDGSAAFDRGLARFRSGTLTDALGDFEAAASVEPDNALYHYYRALALYDLHGAEAAQDALAQAVATEQQRPITGWGKKMERVQGRNRVWVEKARREAGLVR